MITIDIWCSHSSDSLLSSLDPSSSSPPLPSFPSCQYSYPLVPLRCQICLVDSSPFLLSDSLLSLPHSVLSPSSFSLLAPVAGFLQASQSYECSDMHFFTSISCSLFTSYSLSSTCGV